MENTEELKEKLLRQIELATDIPALEQVRVTSLGRKGLITELMKALGKLTANERKAAGHNLNILKNDIASAIDARRSKIDLALLEERLAEEGMDVTLPVRLDDIGRLHPISQTMDEVITIFGQMGLEIAEGPDIEDDFHNFTALNIPPEHPARAMHDTFFFPRDEKGEQYLLRTHTSPVQIRTMMNQEPPIRIVAPGRTYRCDYDLTHTPMFHQIEGLVIDETTHLGHLKGCLAEFVRTYFGIDELPTRFRPSFFPFTEPSAEMDIGCSRKNGELKIGAGGEWLEILGCGMVHPNVLQACDIDPQRYRGFAFGVGIERLAMLKYGIPDLRTFFESDLRWLKHYGFLPLDIPTLRGGLAR